MKHGVGKDGKHLYPAFPYTSYQRMKVEDIIDLKAFLDTLPPVDNVVPDHDLPFPFNIRRGLGLWQLRLCRRQDLRARPAGERPRSIAAPIWSRDRAIAANATRRATSPAR